MLTPYLPLEEAAMKGRSYEDDPLYVCVVCRAVKRRMVLSPTLRCPYDGDVMVPLPPDVACDLPMTSDPAVNRVIALAKRDLEEFGLPVEEAVEPAILMLEQEEPFEEGE